MSYHSELDLDQTAEDADLDRRDGYPVSAPAPLDRPLCIRCKAQPRADLSILCVACRAIELADFHHQANQLADEFAQTARKQGDEAQAKRIERGKHPES